MKKSNIIGYTTGVFDLFHVGHLNIIKNARAMCDYLVVGVSDDQLAAYKGKTPVIPYEDRVEIVRSLKYVDAVIPQRDMDKLTACKKINATIMFVGDDWYGTEKWKTIESELADNGIRTIYFPYTEGVSSTEIALQLGVLGEAK